MNKISVENYRSIKKSPEIELKPITVLVGKNSAGKSSFIRLFPLLKQSLESKIAEPLLWYGDYVDFGGFKNAVSDGNKDKPIVLKFSVGVSSSRYEFNSRNVEVLLELVILENYIKEIHISFFDQKIDMYNEEDGNTHVYINNDDSIWGKNSLIYFRNAGNIIPDLFIRMKRSEEIIYSKEVDYELIHELDKYIFGNKSNNSTHNFNRFRYDQGDCFVSKERVLDIFREFNKEKFKNTKISGKLFNKYINYYIAIRIQEIIFLINQAVNEDMKETTYIKPIRALVDRYYRVQGVSIDEVDADGSNIPMILKNMSQYELNQFEKWCFDKFGIVFSVDSYEGHISMVVKNNINSNVKINLADTGYGYSQMLPIVMLLWRLSLKKIGFDTHLKTIVIEQPELHLHPAYQARMIDVFVNVLKEAKKAELNLKIIFETHSETMINRLGALIENNEIDQNDITVLVFNKNGDETDIECKQYDEDGLLRGWPVDFFAPEELI